VNFFVQEYVTSNKISVFDKVKFVQVERQHIGDEVIFVSFENAFMVAFILTGLSTHLLVNIFFIEIYILYTKLLDFPHRVKMH